MNWKQSFKYYKHKFKSKQNQIEWNSQNLFLKLTGNEPIF
jgi:hypothetical protein